MGLPGPLTGIRVLDFTHVLAGPFATMLLGDLGAEIIKIEKPGTGDSVRLSGPPFKNGESAYFVGHNRNKKSVCLDLKTQEGVDLIKRLIREFDVVVENFRPGVMERLGLGYEELRRLRPDLVYGAINAFGDEGPYKDKPGFELIVQALTGLVSVNTEPGRKPFKYQIQVVDLCAGNFLALAIVAALFHRQRTGRGQKVQTSLLSSTMAMMANLAGLYFFTGRVPKGMFTKNPQAMPSQCFQTRDSHIAVVTQPQHWAKFCEALGRREWARDPDLSDVRYRITNYDQVESKIEEVTRTKTTAEWLSIFNDNDVAAAPMNDVEDVFSDPQVKALGIVKKVTHKTAGELELLSPPWQFSESAGGIETPPPVLGEHTSSVLAQLGLSELEIESLKEQQVIFDKSSPRIVR